MTRSPAPAAVLTAFVLCVAIWGSTFLFIAIGNDTVPPVWAATLRLVLAAAILFAVMAVRGLAFPRGAALTAAALYGFFQFGLNFPLLYLSEARAPSGLAAVVFATIPLSTALFARWFGLERLSARRVWGALIAVGGIAVMFSGQASGATRPLDLAELLLATWAACLGSVFLKRGPHQSPIVTNAVGSLVGLPMCLIWTLVLREPLALPTTAAALLPILYLALAGSVGAFVLYAWMVNYVDISRLSYIAVIVPIAAVSLGAWVRHERLGWPTLVGAAVVMVGVAVGLSHPRAQASAVSSSSKASTG
jgi:drug/metabolite transporter (DMT)-like permease